jgi:transketolase
MHAWRPCDAVESAVSWKSAIERFDGPSALIFSRQGLPHQERSAAQVADIAKGAYILKDSVGTPEAILIATGSEVGLAMDAAQALAAKGKNIRVVSMPCAEIFCKQNAAYIESVLPASVVARVAVEALHKDYWYKFVGLNGAIVGMETFGESAPISDLMKHFGFTVDKVVAAVEGVL